MITSANRSSITIINSRRSSQSAPKSSVKCASSVTRSTSMPRWLAMIVRTSLALETWCIALVCCVDVRLLMVMTGPPNCGITCGIRATNWPRNVVLFQNFESVAIAPQFTRRPTERCQSASGTRPVLPTGEPEPWLRSQLLLHDKKPTVAAALLFADEPQALLPAGQTGSEGGGAGRAGCWRWQRDGYSGRDGCLLIGLPPADFLWRYAD